MAGRIDDVDVGTLVGHGAVLRQNGNAALFFQIVAVHHALGNVLVRSERTRLLQQLVDQRGFAVVNVGDYGDVAKGAGHGVLPIKQSPLF